MRLLQVGVAKSGNYWLYRILRAIMQASNHDTRSFISDHPIQPLARTWNLSYREQSTIDVLDVDPASYFYRISSVFRMPLDDIESYLARTSQVWTHSTFCGRTADLLPRMDKVVYLIRDPRDVAVSQARFQFTPYMLQFYPHTFADPHDYLSEMIDFLIDHWVRHVTGYLGRAAEFGIHLVFYERLCYDFESELRRLLDYLDIGLSSTDIAELLARLQLGSMRRDNPDHVRKGGYGGWEGNLTRAQKFRAWLLAGPVLTELGYPRTVPTEGPGAVVPLPPDPNRRDRLTWLSRRSTYLSLLLKAWRRSVQGIS